MDVVGGLGCGVRPKACAWWRTARWPATRNVRKNRGALPRGAYSGGIE